MGIAAAYLGTKIPSAEGFLNGKHRVDESEVAIAIVLEGEIGADMQFGGLPGDELHFARLFEDSIAGGEWNCAGGGTQNKSECKEGEWE